MTERRMLEASLRISRNQSPAPLLSVALTLTTPRTIATPDGMKTSLVIPLVILFASQAAAQIVLDEHFTDGTLSFGSDPNDGNFLRQGGTSQTIGIVTDNVIGGGNALAYSNQTNGTLFIGQLQTPATLVFIGQTIDFSFDFRFTSLPSTPNSSIFRFGLYNHIGSAPSDGGSETNPDSGYIYDFGAGGSAGDVGWAKESGGSDSILGGSGAASIPEGTITPVAVDINDTLAHHVLCEFALTASGLSLLTVFDGQPVDSATDSTPFTSFNEVAFRLFGGPAAVNYDNLVVQIAVPEPSPALVTVGAALLCLFRSKLSRARS